MKNRVLNFCLLALGGLLLFSCERYEEVTLYSGPDFTRFQTFESQASEKAPDPVAIPVVFSSKEGVDASGSCGFKVEGGVEGTDYTIANPSATLTFNKDNDFTDEILIQPVDNDIDAPEDIVLTITLENPSSGVVGFPGPSNDTTVHAHFMTIKDDDCTVIPIQSQYTSLSRGTSTDNCCPDEVIDFASELTLTDLGNNVYRINDFSGGLYLEWYTVYGITSQNDSPGNIELVDPVNGVMQFPAGQTEFFGSPLNGSGTYDPCTGIISYSWTNGFNDEGDVVMTPK